MRKGDKHMFAARYITEEDRQKIKENRQKERELRQYTYQAVQRMSRIESGWKHKNYKDKY